MHFPVQDAGTGNLSGIIDRFSGNQTPRRTLLEEIVEIKPRHVQLAWQGLRKQLSLFVTPQGRCVLFHQQRLAAFLQAGLLLPAQDESLTVRATRTALAKLDADPSRLLN